MGATKGQAPDGVARFLLGLPEQADLCEVSQGLAAWQFNALPEVRFEGIFDESRLNDLALEIIAHEGLDGALSFVQSVVVPSGVMESPEVQAIRERLLQKYGDTVFTKVMPKTRPVRGPFGEATIEIRPGVTPAKQRPYHFQGERSTALCKIVDQLVSEGKLEKGRSAWSSPAFPVPKKRPGEYRLVVDYRALNDATVGDAHPLPRIEDLLQRQGQFKIWTVLDMKDGYHQVPLREKDRHFTCMTTPQGTYQWTVLVLGLKNGGPIFQRMMEWVLLGLECANVYIDDVIIGSTGDSWDECLSNHERDVETVLDRLAEHKLIVDERKAHLFTTEVEFCGHVLRDGRREPAPGKLLSIQKWDLPRTVTQLRGFLGLTNYYSSYVPQYAEYAGPLMAKLQLNREDGKKGSTKPIVWKESDKESFRRLKEVLAQRLELFRVDPDSPFVMRADASDKAIGAVLEQRREVTPGETSLVPVGFFSRKLAKGQLNWTPREKETYAVVSALRKWAGWIGFQPVLILTDHKSLEDWVKEKMDTPSGPAGRRARWHETLSKFDLQVQYLPGKENVVADALSRFAYPACKAFQDASFHGSAQARLEMKEIIAQELAEGRTLGLITSKPAEPGPRLMLIAGTVSRPDRIPPHRVYAITRGGARTSGDKPEQPEASEESPGTPEGTDQGVPESPEINSDEERGPPLVPAASSPSQEDIPETTGPTEVDEYGNEVNQSPRQPGGRAPQPEGVAPSTPATWPASYEASPHWGPRWTAARTPGMEWPEGVRLHGERMLWDGKVCVPEDRVLEVLKAQHEFTGHIGIHKLVKEANRRYAFPPGVRIYECARVVRRGCVVCQACDPPNWGTSLPITPTPVPNHVMTSVALDVFALPNAIWQGQAYDSLLVCVDRLTGWIIARPCQKAGLTAERAAHLIMDGGWETFGIPSIITSDQGAQFVGQWWKTMCARLGIRQAYSQAYRPQANGRAEVAGKSLIGILRKLNAEDQVNWIEALPRVLRAYHDNPGESGHSPFQLMFGRDRNLAGAPYELVRECEDSKEFFLRMEELDRLASEALNAQHIAEARRVNAGRSMPPPYHPGDLVWYLRPRGSQVSKLDTWWLGPCKVLRRTGNLSYEIVVKPNVTQDVHLDQLKPYCEDVLHGTGVELFHYSSGYKVLHTQPDEWDVERILRHRRNSQGKLEFLTQWEGADPGETTWEPAGNFVPRYNYKFVEYLQKINWRWASQRASRHYRESTLGRGAQDKQGSPGAHSANPPGAHPSCTISPASPPSVLHCSFLPFVCLHLFPYSFPCLRLFLSAHRKRKRE